MSSQLLWLSWRRGCDACKRQVALRNWTPTGSCQVCKHAVG
jgi:rRNA maturation endonuclease Nob1